MQLSINGRRVEVDAEPEMPILWMLRDALHLTGTKYGCGIGRCGACTVHLDGQATRACVVPVAAAAGRALHTIETQDNPQLAALQRAWIELQVPQCGYCQSGMLMAAAALLAQHAHPQDAAIDAAMTNLCRCGSYQRVRQAIHRAAAQLAGAA